MEGEQRHTEEDGIKKKFKINKIYLNNKHLV